MNNLKVCFVGIGSIAKRHIKNLKEICKKENIKLIIDAYRHKISENKELIELGIANIFTQIEDIDDNYDIIFITNPTDLHVSTLKNFHNKGKHFFIEKPISSINQIEELNEIKWRKNSVYYVACPLRYNAVIQYIKKNILLEDIISVRSISSSYLPEWRPGTDYRKTYSAHKNMGGGVSIDLIHEWDYLTYLLNTPLKVHSFIGKKSSLEIDSDDYAIYIAEYEDKIVELHLDYFGRAKIRKIEVFTKEDTIIGDIENNKIYFLKEKKEISFNEERDDYQKRELTYFLNMVLEKSILTNEVFNAIKVLKLTEGRI